MVLNGRIDIINRSCNVKAYRSYRSPYTKSGTGCIAKFIQLDGIGIYPDIAKVTEYDSRQNSEYWVP